jgi:hypothetical protein
MTRTATEAVTRIVRIHHDDGSTVEAEVTPAMAKALRRMEWADAKREERHRGKVKTFTDAKINPAKVAKEKQVKGATPKAGLFEGPRPLFTLLYGFSAIWSGPESLWLTADGGKTWTCRFCSHVRQMPAYGCCLNSDCNRTGADG